MFLDVASKLFVVYGEENLLVGGCSAARRGACLFIHVSLVKVLSVFMMSWNLS